MNSTSLVGNLVRDPKLTYSQGNKTPIARFTVAVNEGQGDNEKSHFVPVTAFGTLAENLSDSLRKGQRVVMVGRLDTYSKPVEIDGEEKNITMVGFIASAIGPDLRWAVAKVAKVEKDSDEDRSSSKSKGRASKSDDDDDDEEEVAEKPKASSKSTAKSRAKAAKAADDDDDEEEF